MHRIQLSIDNGTDAGEEPLRMEACDAAAALLVADINVQSGSAELWDGNRRLARLIKHSGPHATFWEIEPG